MDMSEQMTATKVVPEPPLRVGYRAGGPVRQVAEDLGLLAEFQGNWRGHGFNITARPFFKGNPPFFLEINATEESLDFTAISGDIPNRGSLQPDLMLHGIRYLQQVTDVETNSGIHIEPGLWIRVPASDDPKQAETYVRQSTIPHGDSLLAQTTFSTTVEGGPAINPVNSTPFTDTVIPGLNDNPTKPITDPAYLKQYLTDKLPAVSFLQGLSAPALIKDPTLLLKKAIAGQTIKTTEVLAISTAAPGSLVNIPFVKTNANATQLDAIFWIEQVMQPNGKSFMQLQYVQRVILNFIGINWPHISVATLKRL
jgi:hypothetical protein